MNKWFRRELLILYAIVLIGAFLRFQGVFTLSFAFTYDVGRDMLTLQEMANFERFPLIGPTTGIPGVFYGPWWYYLLLPFFVVSGGNPQFIAFIMALIGTLTIVLGYLLGKKVAGEIAGLSVAALISVSPYLVSLSSQIWNPNIAPLFVLALFWVLYQVYKEKKPSVKLFFLIGLLLSFLTDIELFFGVFMTLGVVVSLLILRKVRLSPVVLGSFVAGYLIVLAPRLLFELRHGFIMTNSLINYVSTGGESERFTSSFTSTVLSRINMFIGEFSSTLAFGNREVGLVLVALLFVLTFIAFKKLEVVPRQIVITIGIVFLSFFLGTVFFSHDIWPHYLVGLPVLYILLFVIVLNSSLVNLKQARLIPLIVLLVFLLNLNPTGVIESLQKPLFEGDSSVYRNQLAVVDYVYSEANGDKFKYVLYTPPLHDYTYKYLFSWYGPSEFGYAPLTQADTAYFILEPDHEQPGRLTSWINERKGDGKIVKEEEVKGGVVVQTRLVK